MLDAERHPKVVQEYLQNELQAGRVVSVPPRWCANVHLSRVGVILEKHQPGKWQLIVDLSYPDGASVNDFIDTSVCSLKYASVDDSAEFVLRSGQGTLLAKLDIKSTDRNLSPSRGYTC